MRAIRSTGTTPELTVRRLAHALGYRFRLHRKDLPGRPDLAFIARHKVVFVHGCFWHQHPEESCSDARIPKSRTEYWLPKLARNAARDIKHIDDLQAMGWKVLVVWDCETKDPRRLALQLRKFLK
jgi:DNA mismatch endonuclease (patch repair protein)